MYQLPKDDAIAPKPVGGLINYTIVYVVYACVELIENINKFTAHVAIIFQCVSLCYTGSINWIV